MNVLVAVDDTDNLGTKGTGHLAERIAQRIEANDWGRRSYITRHQLFVHPDVPYTSHGTVFSEAKRRPSRESGLPREEGARPDAGTR